MPDKKKLIIYSVLLLTLFAGIVYILIDLNRLTKTTSTQSLSVNKIVAIPDKAFYIELIANTSTGYQWQADFDTKLLKLNNVSFRQVAEKDKLGSDEKQVFEFQALEKVNTLIRFRYVKPWEANTPPQETKEFEVSYQ